jgi:hypothetical protein
VLDEIDERVKRLRRQGDGFAVPAREQPPARIEPEVAEFKHLGGGGAHGGSYLLRKLQAHLRTGQPLRGEHRAQEDVFPA